MASQNIPTSPNVWKRDLQRLLGLITVVILLDRFVATDSFQKLIFPNVWKRDLQRLLGLITVVILLDRFVATDFFQDLQRLLGYITVVILLDRFVATDSFQKLIFRDLQRLLGLITVVIPLDRFVATDSFQKYHYRDFLIVNAYNSTFLTKVCVHLTSEDLNEILNKYRSHLSSISLSTSTLKKAKDKAYKLDNAAECSFQRIEVASFFKRLDPHIDTNATKSLARAYDRCVENTDVKDDRPSKRLRQETIISEDDKKQPDTNTVFEVDDDDDFDEREDVDKDKDAERVEEKSHSSNYVTSSLMVVFSESCSQQQTSSDSFLLPLLENYFAKETSSLYDPAHSFIIDLSPSSKIRGEFNDKQWVELVGRRPNAVRKTYHHEIEPLVAHLFSQKMDLSQARKGWYELRNLAAPIYDDGFSYAEVDWEKIKRWVERVTGQLYVSLRNPLKMTVMSETLKLDGNFYVPWGEISVLSTQRRRNNDKDKLTEQVERSHQVDLLCNYEQYEVACALACGGPYTYNLTKLASDEFNLPRIMKDMLDDLELKFLYAGNNVLQPYIVGIQTYMTQVRIYLIEKREVYFLHHLKSFNLPLTFSTYHHLKSALRVAWNIRGLVNALVREFDNVDDDGFKTPPVTSSDKRRLYKHHQNN
ncbi:hypothetical protein G9A89_010498 [Geosiphon pyriformis]|nr:hypothetical protein G9A89_010498 [Geosiphon pyriformis]